jgi:basic amino acid/polyamine antiporter, APA family
LGERIAWWCDLYQAKIMKNNKPLGFWTATSLVTGNMIGSGIYLLPASLAAYGGISIYGWLFSALGSLALAFVFASLARRIRGSGGPYIYTRSVFGDLPGFTVAWGYWISIIATNAAVAVALVSYLSVFFPVLKQQGAVTAAAALFFIWLLVAINIRGMKHGGRVQLSTTILKVLPLLGIAVVGLFYLEPAHFTPWNLSSDSDFSAVSATAIMTMWAFLGLESANNPADEVENPSKNVPRAAVLGTLIAAAVYIPSTVAVMGLISPEKLAVSSAPFAEAAALLWGDWGYYLVGLGAVISCFGTLNGWTLCIGQIPMAAAKDKLFPKFFAERNHKGSPAKGIIISSLLVSALVLMNYQAQLVAQFTFIILLATLATLLPYLLCSIAQLVLYFRLKATHPPSAYKVFITIYAVLFSIWMIFHSGTETIVWGLVLLLAGLPVYLLQKRENCQSS